MRYSVEFSKKARRELKKLDPNVALTITKWIRKNLEGCENPRRFGKSLTGNGAIGLAIIELLQKFRTIKSLFLLPR